MPGKKVADFAAAATRSDLKVAGHAEAVLEFVRTL